MPQSLCQLLPGAWCFLNASTWAQSDFTLAESEMLAGRKGRERTLRTSSTQEISSDSLAAFAAMLPKRHLLCGPEGRWCCAGMIDDQLHGRSDAGEGCCEGMELERADSRFHEWAAIDRNGSVVSLGR